MSVRIGILTRKRLATAFFVVIFLASIASPVVGLFSLRKKPKTSVDSSRKSDILQNDIDVQQNFTVGNMFADDAWLDQVRPFRRISNEA